MTDTQNASNKSAAVWLVLLAAAGIFALKVVAFLFAPKTGTVVLITD